MPPPRSTLFPYTTLFRSKEVDELMLVDITASREGKGPAFDTIRDIASECFMPVAYGGGVRTLEDIRRDRKSTRLNSSHLGISYAVFCLKKKKKKSKH